jgi:TPP-dependent pyruvate/acetoin dehydrogenase alpha subunit
MTTSSQAGLGELTEMRRIRGFEERVRELSLGRQIIGSVHLCIGQEAIAVGTCAVLQPQDAVFATYRGHGWALARGVPMAPIFAELLGRTSGLNGGRGGSAYFTAPAYGFFGENSIVGGGAPIAVGAALAGRFDGSNRVAIVAFGDGATNQGAVHEAMNFAAALSLPVVFVCENNTYSELTPIADMVGDPELWHRAAAYGMPGMRIDGNSVAEVRDTMTEAVERARGGHGPSFVEAMTERLVGHYIGDVEQYRPAGEVDSAWTREPIGRLSRELTSLGTGEDAVRAAIQTADDEVTHAADEALAATPASADDIEEHLYA